MLTGQVHDTPIKATRQYHMSVDDQYQHSRRVLHAAGQSPGYHRPTAAAAGLGLNVNITLFSHVTLISKVQSTSDHDHFHARDLPCSHVKSLDDPISGCRGYSFIYTLCPKKTSHFYFSNNSVKK